MGRTFTDRWFSWPWCPWVKTWTYVPRLPDPNVYRMSQPSGPCLVMHTGTLDRLKKTMGAKHFEY